MERFFYTGASYMVTASDGRKRMKEGDVQFFLDVTRRVFTRTEQYLRFRGEW
ncbi:MAG TPA: hypothetical protein PK358_08925 [Spirochaetota bacterium]|nr:hypothetical protein [Spirochaetota bacterium]HPJ34942.1 hypothetical protein [Spirochaetota bacterium]